MQIVLTPVNNRRKMWLRHHQPPSARLSNPQSPSITFNYLQSPAASLIHHELPATTFFCLFCGYTQGIAKTEVLKIILSLAFLLK